ncbi:hypothetical protein H311_02708 [Anncaliia algerae PRA109]|nr:hypothetical protein H311_02708 [Anncaliia algerae PRA109]
MYQWIKNIVWHVYMIYKTSNSSFFDIPKDKAVKSVQHFDKLECIDKMNEIFKEFSDRIKYFSYDNNRWNNSEDGIHNEKKEFFEKLLSSEYFNGDNFPIKYKNELENLHKLLNFPIIYKKEIKYGNLIFNNIKLSTSGNELKSKFRNLIIISNEGFKLYFDFRVKVEELHKKFFYSDLNNELVWDQAFFKLIPDIRNLFDLHKKNYDGIYKSFYEFSCIFQYFYKEWLHLNDNQKCSLLFDFNVKDYSKLFLKSIYKKCKNKKEEIKEIYERLHAFIDKSSHLISNIKVDNNILGKFLSFIFDCELFSSKCEKFRLFAVVFKGFYNKPQYEYFLTHVNKYDLLFSDVENLKSNVMKNEVLQTTKEIVYKRILLTINSQSKPFEDFIATKNQDLKILDLTGKNKLIKLFQKYLELPKKDLEKLIKDLANMNYCCNLIPKNRLEYYSAYSFFSSYDSSAELAALINMKSEFQKQLGFLRCGSKNSCDKSRYLETEKRIRQFESGINDYLGLSHYFYYLDDEILSSSS